MPPSDQEPRYRLVDSNGNVVGSLFVNASGNVEIQDETATGTVFGPNGIDTSGLTTQKADITNETYIKASRGAQSSGNAAGVRVNIVDTEDADNLNEFDTNAEFTPAETGKYRIDALAEINPGGSNDRLDMDVRDSSGGFVERMDTSRSASSSSGQGLSANTVLELTAGTAYRVSVADQDSSFDVGLDSRLSITKEFSNA